MAARNGVDLGIKLPDAMVNHAGGLERETEETTMELRGIADFFEAEITRGGKVWVIPYNLLADEGGAANSLVRRFRFIAAGKWPCWLTITFHNETGLKNTLLRLKVRQLKTLVADTRVKHVSIQLVPKDPNISCPFTAAELVEAAYTALDEDEE